MARGKKLTPEEEEQICHYLAFTGNQAQTARETGFSEGTVNRMARQKADHIQALRADKRVRLADEFDLCLLRTLHKYRELLEQLTMKNAAELTPALFNLSKCTAIHTERRQALCPAPAHPGDGQESAAAPIPSPGQEAARARVKGMLKQMNDTGELDEVLTEMSGRN